MPFYSEENILMTMTGEKLGALMDGQRRLRGLSVTELAKRAGVNQPTTHRILAGESKSPKVENLERLARALDMDLSKLLHGVSERTGTYASDLREGPAIKGRVPVISWVQAGMPSEAIDLYAPGVAEDWLDCPFPHSSSAFCLIIKGLSMFPDYRPDEIILVDPEVPANHGDDVVARNTDGEVTFKRLQITEDGTYLLAINPDFPNRIIPLTAEDAICGVVTGSWIKRR